MGLLDSVLKFTGRTIHVHPFYGWGWASAGKDVAVPGPFSMRILRFWDHNGSRRGGIGRVEQTGYEYDEFWATFSTRHVGEFDFEDHFDTNGSFNLSLSEIEPVENSDGWPISRKSDRDLGGYADIVATDQGYTCGICERLAAASD